MCLFEKRKTKKKQKEAKPMSELSIRTHLLKLLSLKIKSASEFYNNGHWVIPEAALIYAIYERALEDLIIHRDWAGIWYLQNPRYFDLLGIDKDWAMKQIRAVLDKAGYKPEARNKVPSCEW